MWLDIGGQSGQLWSDSVLIKQVLPRPLAHSGICHPTGVSPFAVNRVEKESCVIMEPETWVSGQSRGLLKETDRNADW